MTETPIDDDASADLSNEEEEEVAEREATSARVVHEVIRREGDDELGRPAGSLAWSGFAGGVAISSSIMGEALLESGLPDAPWRPAVASIGYSLGFLIVVLGRLQLFTESTLLGVIPVVAQFTASNMGRLARLWGLVFVANLAGTFAIAALVHVQAIGLPEHREAMIALSRQLLEHDALATFRGAIPAGFLMAAIAWTLPAGRRQEFWIVLMLTYFIALGGFSHVVAGSGEAWLLLLSGQASLGWVLGGFLLPALAGNIVGGTLIFALLAHAQVRQEI